MKPNSPNGSPNTESTKIFERFRTFTLRLAPPLRALALSRGTYLGTGVDLPTSILTAPPSGLSVMGSLPFCFRDAFDVPAQTLEDLSYCATIGMLYALATDKIIDKQVDVTPTHHFLVSVLYGEFQRALAESVSSTSAFWPLYDQYLREYHVAELTHRGHCGERNSFDNATYRLVAQQKSSPVKFVVVALACICERQDLIDRYTPSVDEFLYGFQLFDDVMDWREDLVAGRLTPVTARLTALLEGTNACTNGGTPSLEGYLHSTDILECTLEQSTIAFEQAARAVHGLPCQNWRDLLGHFAEGNRAKVAALVETKVRILLASSDSRPTT